MKHKVLVGAGFALLLLAAIGLLLPIWPTTPFVLGAAGCFAGSPRLTGWLKRSRVFKEYIERYQKGTAITKATVVKSLVFLWGMLALSAALMHTPWAWGLLLVVGVSVTWHILAIARGGSKAKSPPETKTN